MLGDSRVTFNVRFFRRRLRQLEAYRAKPQLCTSILMGSDTVALARIFLTIILYGDIVGNYSESESDEESEVVVVVVGAFVVVGALFLLGGALVLGVWCPRAPTVHIFIIIIFIIDVHVHVVLVLVHLKEYKNITGGQSWHSLSQSDLSGAGADIGWSSGTLSSSSSSLLPVVASSGANRQDPGLLFW
jgi:hypothetical protein